MTRIDIHCSSYGYKYLNDRFNWNGRHLFCLRKRCLGRCKGFYGGTGTSTAFSLAAGWAPTPTPCGQPPTPPRPLPRCRAATASTATQSTWTARASTTLRRPSWKLITFTPEPMGSFFSKAPKHRSLQCPSTPPIHWWLLGRLLPLEIPAATKWF